MSGILGGSAANTASTKTPATTDSKARRWNMGRARGEWEGERTASSLSPRGAARKDIGWTSQGVLPVDTGRLREPSGIDNTENAHHRVTNPNEMRRCYQPRLATSGTACTSL